MNRTYNKYCLSSAGTHLGGYRTCFETKKNHCICFAKAVYPDLIFAFLIVKNLDVPLTGAYA